MNIGDTVRIKPFTHCFGKVVDMRPEHLQSVGVHPTTPATSSDRVYNDGRVVWLRPQDVDL